MIIKEKWSKDDFMSDEEFSSLLSEAFAWKFFEKRKILAIIPDGTRSGPTGLVFRTVLESLYGRAIKIDFMIALGTHPAMNNGQLEKLLAIDIDELRTKYPESTVYQHCWDDARCITEVGRIPSKEIYEISKGLLDEDIFVTVNRRLLEYDAIMLIGPVFPHEVVGFSGGYKYIFPGVSGPHFLHKFHWLGALITNPKINGTKDTPVRDAINKAVSFIEKPIVQVCYVVKDKKVYGLFVGDNQAWSLAADLSAELNIKYVKKSYKTVLSMAPVMYDDIWTAGKCMYKLEPVVADGGTLIIYAPHITEVSYTHGKYIEEIGYHTRDYFVKQWEKFKHYPGGILAHSTHVKGIGTFIDGRETARINVYLATSIPEHICKKINLGYINPDTIDLDKLAEEPDTLVVKNAGEVLFRLESGEVPDIDKLYKK
ncbi:MAG: lactate racemase domain-containing protein [Candidatus Omnitrophica bacterium]|nr:lactate racemase domain-containing protein [Candidatus Omnitrophota bacterium]